jgi:hypothetical protein
MAGAREVIAEIGQALATRDREAGSRRDYENETMTVLANRVADPEAPKAVVTRVSRIRTV